SRLARQLSASIAHRWMPAADWITWTIEGDPERDWEQPAMDGASAKTEGDASPADPAYPDGYPPHKWKIGVTTAGHNCVDVRSNDLGLVVRHASGQPVVDCYAGGSLGYRP